MCLREPEKVSEESILRSAHDICLIDKFSFQDGLLTNERLLSWRLC